MPMDFKIFIRVLSSFLVMQLRGYRRLFQVIDQRVKETRWRGSLSRGLLDFSWEAIKK